MGKPKVGRPKNKKKRETKVKPKSGEEKEITKKVHNWVQEAIERERRGERVFQDSREKAHVTGEICGMAKRTVQRIMKNTECNDEGEKETRGKKGIVFDDFDKTSLSRLIMGYYKRLPPEIPTLNKIYADSQKMPGFPKIGRTKLYLLMKSLGFVCRKRNCKMLVYQRMDIVAQRHKILHDLPKYRAENYEIFYQDETWVNTNHTRQHVWQNFEFEKDDRSELIKDTKWQGG